MRVAMLWKSTWVSYVCENDVSTVFEEKGKDVAYANLDARLLRMRNVVSCNSLNACTLPSRVETLSCAG